MSVANIAAEIQAFVYAALHDGPFHLRKVQRDSIQSQEAWLKTIATYQANATDYPMAIVGVDMGTPAPSRYGSAQIRQHSVEIYIVCSTKSADPDDPMSTIDAMLAALCGAWVTMGLNAEDSGFTTFRWDGYPPIIDTDVSNDLQRRIAAQKIDALGGCFKVQILSQ